MEFPTLYKQTATGAINRWTILVESNYYWTEFGKVDGVLQTSDRTYCEAKNVGRSNETTSDQQAVLEASSVWKKKRDRDGFVMSLDELQELVFDPPMLAKKFDGNYKKEMKFIQPKLDGIRCNISCNTGEVQSLSRHNMAFNTTKHIEGELKELLESNKHLHLDGELYNHDLHDDFNKIVSLVRKKKLTNKDKEEIESKIKYYVYDAWFDGNDDMSFSERSKFISDNLSNMNNVVVVPTFEVNSREEVDKYFDMFRKDGYEGAIIRTDAPYEHKRSKNLLKYKEFQDDEFEIVDVNIGKNQTIAESLTIKLKNDKLCNATLALPDEVCKQILENKENYIGKTATVCYFGITNDGLLRFPVVKAIDRQSYE